MYMGRTADERALREKAHPHHHQVRCFTRPAVLSRAAQLENRSPCGKQVKVRSQGPMRKGSTCEVFADEERDHEM